MSRKSAVTELQVEEATVNSPIRRSSRIINGTSAAAITTRRTSQNGETEAPAKVTRTRRTSTQSNEERPDPKAASSKKDIEAQPKAVRTRRNSRANSEDLEVDAPKNANVTVRKKLTKASQKTPVRASVRRRNSATEEEGTSTPVKATARGRVTSDAENLQDMEKDGVQKDSKTSGTPKENGQLGEVPKIALRRSRRLSTDENLAHTPPVVPRRITRRSSISQDEEADAQKLSEETDTKKVNPLNVKITPIKKRKLVEVVESELDLSVINESVGDINCSPNQSTDQVFLKGDSPKSSRSGSAEKSPKTTSPKSESSKATEYASPIRKSPRLSEKSLSPCYKADKNKSDVLTSSPQQSVAVELQDEKPSARNSASLNNSQDVVETNGTICSLKVHSEIQNAAKLNNSGGSNKENIDLVEKNLIDMSEKNIDIAPTVKARVSNVFKPNQKECSFMEPMEVDECSFSEAVDSGMDTNLNLDQSSVIISKSVPICSHIKHTETADVDAFKDASSLFNKKIASDTLTERSTEISALNDDSSNANRTNRVSSAVETSGSNPETVEKAEEIIIIINNSLETKIFPSRKSSSPIPIKKRLSIKSNSPVVSNDSANNEEDEDCNRLSVASRTGTSKSKTASPVKKSRKSRSKSPLPKTSSIGTANVNTIRTSQSFSPILNTATESNRATIEQSFEKPMGSEEVLVSSDKIYVNYNEETHRKTTEAKNLEKTPNTSVETAESIKSIGNDSTENANVGLAHNNAEYNSMQITHYDFYLPSDDELLDESEVTASAGEKGLVNRSQLDHLVKEGQSTTSQKSEPSQSVELEYQALTQVLNDQVVGKNARASVSNESAKGESIETKSAEDHTLEQCQETDLAEESKASITSPAEETDRRFSLQLIQEQSQDSNSAEQSKAARASPVMEAAKRQSVQSNTTNDQAKASMSKQTPKKESIELKRATDQAAKQSQDEKVVEDGQEDTRTSLPKSSVEGETIESNNKAGADESETEIEASEELELVSARAEDNGVDSPKVFQTQANVSKNNSYTTFDIAESGKSKIDKSAVLQQNATFLVDCENESIDGVSSSETDLKIVLSDSNTETSQQEISSEDNINDADVHIVKDDSADKSTVKDLNEEASHILLQTSQVTPACSKNTETQLEVPNAVLISSEDELSSEKSYPKDNSQINNMDTEAELLRKCEHTKDSSNKSVVVPDSSSEEEVVSSIEVKNSEPPQPEMSDIVHNQKCNNSENTSIESNKSARKLEEGNSDSCNTEEAVKAVKSPKKTPKKMNPTHIPTPEPAIEPAKSNTKSPSPSKESKKESLHASASSKLSEYLMGKLDEVLDSSSEESEVAYSEFIAGISEGEEDTPSEDSNAIPDEGESIGYSDSEVDNSDDDYDENDSFICNDDVSELLSGEEYDLSSEVKKEKPKKSRIIDLDLISDTDIIKVPRKKVDKKPNKRTRIIEISDSSSEAETIMDIPTKCEEQENSSANSNGPVEDPGIAEDIAITNSNNSAKSTVIENPEVIAHSDLTLENISVIDVNSSIQKACRKSSLSIQENVVGGVKDPLSTERINTLMESFCSAVKKGEISLNVSLEYEEHPKPASLENEKADCINVISDVQIRPSNLLDESPKQVIEAECVRDPEFKTSSEGDVKSSKTRAKRKRKRSMSVSELCAETPEDKEPDFSTNSESALKGSEKRSKVKRKVNKGGAAAFGEELKDSRELEVAASDVKNHKKKTKLKEKLNNSASEVSVEIEDSEEPNFTASSEGFKKGEKLKQRLNSSAGELSEEVGNSEGPNFNATSEGSKKGEKLKQRLSNSACELYAEIEDSEEPELSANSEGDVKEMQIRAKMKRRLSKSVSELQEEEKTTKRRKRNRKRKKATSLTSGEETNMTKDKRKPDQLNDLKTETFGLMNQLITDVKNRPKRTVKPSTSLDVDGLWTVSDTPNIKPSKSAVCKREIIRMTTKLHPSDFKNLYLSDPKRVKRIETKDLLRKKGAYY